MNGNGNGRATFVGPVMCPECETALGRVVKFKGKLYLDDGLMLVLVGLRRCHVCGRLFHWHGEKQGELGPLPASS